MLLSFIQSHHLISFHLVVTNSSIDERGSRARISKFNIVRNGFGSKRLSRPTDIEEDELDTGNDQLATVPSGHSGTFWNASFASRLL